jgi:hypothetical protein
MAGLTLTQGARLHVDLDVASSRKRFDTSMKTEPPLPQFRQFVYSPRSPCSRNNPGHLAPGTTQVTLLQEQPRSPCSRYNKFPQA